MNPGTCLMRPVSDLNDAPSPCDECGSVHVLVMCWLTIMDDPLSNDNQWSGHSVLKIVGSRNNRKYCQDAERERMCAYTYIYTYMCRVGNAC